MNALDTHGLVKRLVAAGFPEPQAEAVTDVVWESRQFDLSNLATKTDIAELKASIAESRADLLKWVIGLLLVQGGAVITLIKLLPGH